MGLRPWFKSQLKCPVVLGPVVMLGPPPSGPTEEQRWWSWGPLLQSPPEGRSLDILGNAAQREVGWGWGGGVGVGWAGCCAARVAQPQTPPSKENPEP